MISPGDPSVTGPASAEARRPRVIVADDDPVARAVLSAHLSERFELVGLAADAEEAISLAQAQEPDAAIIDLEMPRGGGLRATREIHARVPHTAIVIMSADEQHDSVVELLVAGAVSYFRKGESGEALAENLLRSIAAHAADVAELRPTA
jgi:DNA-binding NarL/FixJ family response regulator